MKFLVLLSYLFFTNFIFAQIGVNIYKDNNLFDSFKAKDSLDVTIMLSEFLSVNKQDGYITASFDSVSFDSLIGDAYFYLGKKYYWENVNFVFSDFHTIRVKNFSEKPVNFELFDIEINRIIRIYENSGYPFVNISFDSLFFVDNKISTQVIVNQGKLILYDSVFFDPKIKTKSKFLQNYLSFKKGKLYNESDILKIENKLNSLQFISVLQKPEIEFHETTADLYLYLANNKVNQLSGLLGFTNVDNKFSLIGQFDFSFVNTFRNADIISLKWKKNKNQSQDLNFNISIPYIFSSSIGFNNSFFLEKFDSSYVNINNRFDLSYYFSGFNKVSTYFQSKRSIVFDSLVDITDYNSIVYGIAVKLENTDNQFNPTSGYVTEFSIGAGKKTVSDSISNLFQSELDIQVFVPLIFDFVIFFQNYSYIIFGDYLFENELLKFGGATFMRGFDEQSFSASFLVLNTVELRYLFDKKSNVFLFSDYAIFEHKTTTEKYWNHPFGFGIGLNLGTKAGIFSLSYALGKSDNSPILLKNAKVHFGFKTLF